MPKYICVCCMNEVKAEGMMCAECMEEIDSELDAANDEREDIERHAAFRIMVQQRCKSHRDTDLNRVQRWLYTLKAYICLFFNLREDLWTADSIEVAYDGYTGGYNASWTEYHVGAGIFRNWHYDIYTNGD
ncbi:hypothetical protein [Cohnella sp. GbtcB17]|uniref:hypothetical protein n=1 Tax=Cohnella sp. GbtcB17 TaxID=2824762 RepID=UPI001C303C81|nr:hypothetical protein [Cohnella sp. GbtcB17]